MVMDIIVALEMLSHVLTSIFAAATAYFVFKAARIGQKSLEDYKLRVSNRLDNEEFLVSLLAEDDWQEKFSNLRCKTVTKEDNWMSSQRSKITKERNSESVPLTV
jgi:hypothetical protein